MMELKGWSKRCFNQDLKVCHKQTDGRMQPTLNWKVKIHQGTCYLLRELIYAFLLVASKRTILKYSMKQFFKKLCETYKSLFNNVAGL